jgi:hypothetical protein
MRGMLRSLVVAAALVVTVGADLASAQTVTVTNVPPGMTVELALNADTIGNTKADTLGRATLPVNLQSHTGRTDTDLNFYIDVCDGLRRVVMVEPGRAMLPAGPCLRKQIAGLYVTRPVTSFVVDFTDTNPWVRLRQGPAPLAWLEKEIDLPRSVERAPSPKGLMVFAAGGVGSFSKTPSIFCGTVSDCSGTGTKLNYQGGGTIWLTRFAAFEASYVGHVTATNAGELTTSSFDSSLSTKVAIVSVKLGLPLKVVRPYIMAGGNYHWATFKTTQVMKAHTATVDDVETAIVGGTQAFQWKTEGKGWVWGAGLEVPVGKVLNLYAEGGYIQLRGRDTGNGEFKMEDSLTYAVAGFKIRLGK